MQVSNEKYFLLRKIGTTQEEISALIESKVCRKMVKEDEDKETKEALRKDQKQTLYR